MEKINVDLYGGKGLFGSKETPLEADEIYCDVFETCSFYEENKCLRCRSFLSPTCKFGKNRVTKGYTSRAQKYYDFKNRYTTDAVYNKLRYPSELVGVMGNTLYMNLKYTDVRKRRESDEAWRRDTEGYIIGDCGFGMNYVFIPLEDVTTTLLNAIFSYKPRAMMGGIIHDYQSKIVPKIIQTLKKVAPEIHRNLITAYPHYDKEPNYIGKKAYINSLKPNTEFMYKGHKWLFDGEYVSTQNFDIGTGSPWWLQGGTRTDVKIKVTDKMTFEVKDNSIVDINTRFE